MPSERCPLCWVELPQRLRCLQPATETPPSSIPELAAMPTADLESLHLALPPAQERKSLRELPLQDLEIATIPLAQWQVLQTCHRNHRQKPPQGLPLTRSVQVAEPTSRNPKLLHHKAPCSARRYCFAQHRFALRPHGTR